MWKTFTSVNINYSNKRYTKINLNTTNIVVVNTHDSYFFTLISSTIKLLALNND